MTTTLADNVGYRSDPHLETVDAERALLFARATNDDSSIFRDGVATPPVFAAVLCGPPTSEVIRAVLPERAWTRMIHFAQDLHFHSPLVPGEVVTSTADAYSVRAISLGTLLCTRATLVDSEGRLRVEMYSTILVLDLTAGGSAGATPPDHRAPRGGSDQREATVHVDVDQTYRYAEASGDRMPVHLDDSVAREMGMPGIILHGMCGLAMAGSALIATVDKADPRRLRRLAVRFLRPVLPGDDMRVSMRRPGRDAGTWSFTVRSENRLVMNDGYAVLGPPDLEVPPSTADGRASP